MRIRITGKGLPRAQFAGQQNNLNRNSISINGTIYFEGDPGYENAKQQADQMKQEHTQFSSFIDSKIKPNTIKSLPAQPFTVPKPNFSKVNSLKTLAPKAPSLTFTPGSNPLVPSASVTPTAKPTTSTEQPTRKWHAEWDEQGIDPENNQTSSTQPVSSTTPIAPFNTGSVLPWGNLTNPNKPSMDSKGLVWGSNPNVVTKEDTEALGFGETAPSKPGFIKSTLEKYNKNIGQPVEKAFEGMDRLVSWANLGTQLVNSYNKKKDFDSFMRRQTSTDSLFPEVSSEMSGNRGDYVVSGSRFGEFRPDEYTVNKGMYTGQFLPRMAQYGGGVIPEALTMPIEPVQLLVPTSSPEVPVEKSVSVSAASSQANPVAEQTWEEVSSQFPGVKHLGIWGDKSHKAKKSDHNTGDALDIGIQGVDQGSQIAQKLIKEAQEKNIKYIIWNKQIWNPSISNSWRPYNGDNPHTDHVHVSFNRGSVAEDEVALSHNNPLNIHYGDFASQYGATQGAKDSNGFVGKFPDFNAGIQAGKDLLFGPNYSNLTISQARNKWVSGSPSKSNNSTSDIVNSMGGDKLISDLSPAEKDKLFKLFAKWEGAKAYNKIKGMNLFAKGGTASPSYNSGDVYELTEDEIKQILALGGDVEFL